MEDAKQQLVDKLKTSTNVLVTVSRNPSVDQLAALIGLTLLLNKQGKHAAAVFSGEVPSTLEFLQPEETIEKNTDSLRDFIIALDKNKADKLRYKVEDNVVRIFITPYKTSITQDDFDFSQGDFNVDLVVALGINQQEDFDETITTHGRILHDATVVSVSKAGENGLGSINWTDATASSLSEMITRLVKDLNGTTMDEQIATALLTGIVAETDRFSNDRTTPETMSASAALMSAGANQQLVANQLSEKPDKGDEVSWKPSGTKDEDTSEDKPAGDKPPKDEPPKDSDGSMAVDHETETDKAEPDKDKKSDSADLKPIPEDKSKQPKTSAKDEPDDKTKSTKEKPSLSEGPQLITEPPALNETTVTDPLAAAASAQSETTGLLPKAEPNLLMDRKSPEVNVEPKPSLSQPPATPFSPPPNWTPPATSVSDQTDDDAQTLIDLEQSVQSPHVDPTSEARDEVDRALTEAATNGTEPPDAIEALNAQPMGENLHPASSSPPSAAPVSDTSSPQVVDPTAPPPVPPPIPFQFGNPSTKQS